MTWQHWEHNEEIHFVQTKHFLWLRYQGVSLKQRRLFLSWSWNCLSCSHVISVPTDLRHLHFLSREKLRQKAAHRNKQSEDVFAFQNIRKYELSLVFRYMFWRACLRLQREKQRYKTYVKCRDIKPMFVCLDVCIHQHQLMHKDSIRAENIRTNWWNWSLHKMTKTHTPLRLFEDSNQETCSQNYFSFTPITW